MGAKFPRIDTLRKPVHVPSIIQASGKIAALFQIMVHVDRAQEHQHIILIHHRRYGHAPELAVVIVPLRHHDLPTVFIHIEGPARVDTPLSGFHNVPYNHPDTMEFIARLGIIRRGQLCRSRRHLLVN